MRLHYSPLSSSSRRVLMTAHVLGLSLDKHIVDLRDPSSRAQLALLNPNKKVPVLEDGDFVLWESIAIVQYLCERTPGQTLYPTESRARADVNRWLSWSQAHWMPPIGALGFEHAWKRFVVPAGVPSDADPEQVKRHEAAFHQFAGVLDAQLATRTWLVGNSLTLADIAVAPALASSSLYKLPLDPFAHLKRWFAGVADLPAWRATEPPKVG